MGAHHLMTSGQHPPGYSTAHMRVRAAKGRAADRICERPSCTRRAYDWAYTGQGSHSFDPDDYIALCRSCHRQHDHASHGEGHASAKLTDQTVREIRRRAAAGTSQRALAREFGVSQPAIMQVVNRRTWKHID